MKGRIKQHVLRRSGPHRFCKSIKDANFDALCPVRPKYPENLRKGIVLQAQVSAL
jgi:hypothetical protein